MSAGGAGRSDGDGGGAAAADVTAGATRVRIAVVVGARCEVHATQQPFQPAHLQPHNTAHCASAVAVPPRWWRGERSVVIVLALVAHGADDDDAVIDDLEQRDVA